MSLTRPTLISVPSFDATQPYTFTFTAQSGSAQIVANQLTIRTQSDNTVVYDEKQETFKYEHVVNADELTNGTYYNAVVSVFDAGDNQSPTSIPIQFWCYSTPSLTFTNIPANNIITNASFNFAFTYNQAEGEAINSYVVNLYNAFQTQIATSGIVYVQTGTPPYDGNYLFAGFEDNTVYYIEVVATTVNGAIISTGQTQFTVNYSRPDLFTLVQLTNNCEEGYITLQSNIALIEGTSNPDPPTYINDQEVDLTEDGSWVEWNDGYSVSGDFLARLWFRSPNPYTQILQFSNAQGQTIIMNYMLGYENVNAPDLQSYVEVYVQSIDGMEYYIFSNYIDTLPDTSYYNVWLTRVNNIYKLQIAAV